MEPIRLTIQETASGVDLQAVENALRMVAGVMSVRAEPSESAVVVEAAEGVEADDLVAAARKAGYVAAVAA
jgi:copper chaperone CopZ